MEKTRHFDSIYQERWGMSLHGYSQHLVACPGDRLGQRVWGFRFWWAASSGFFFERNKRSSSSTNKHQDTTSFWSKLGMWCTCIYWVLYIKKTFTYYVFPRNDCDNDSYIYCIIQFLSPSIWSSKLRVGIQQNELNKTGTERTQARFGCFLGDATSIDSPTSCSLQASKTSGWGARKRSFGWWPWGCLLYRGVSWITKRSWPLLNEKTWSFVCCNVADSFFSGILATFVFW